MVRRTLFYLLLCVGIGILISGCSQERNQSSSERMEKAADTVPGNKPHPHKIPEASLRDSPAHVKPREPIEIVGSPDTLTKHERINDLYDSLTEADLAEYDRWGRHPKEIEILAEGMDAFTAAQYFRSHGGYGYIDYANEYAKRAMAENPGNFEILLFYAQTLALDQMDEQEATYRQLYEMAPDSVEVLYELGNLLSMRKPNEAVVYLEKLVVIDPSYSWAYGALGVSYRELGHWDEAVKAFQKQIEINPQIKWMTDGAIELVNKLRQEAETRNSVDIEIEDPPSEMPSPATSPSHPNNKQASVEIQSDLPKDEFKPRRQTGPTEAQKEAFNKFIRQLKEYEQTMPRDQEGFGRRFDNLMRAIEREPNRSDNLLKLGRAYEDIDDFEKADTIYKQAKNRFPSDKRVQSAQEGFRERREQRRERGASPPSRRDNRDAPGRKK